MAHRIDLMFSKDRVSRACRTVVSQPWPLKVHAGIDNSRADQEGEYFQRYNWRLLLSLLSCQGCSLIISRSYSLILFKWHRIWWQPYLPSRYYLSRCHWRATKIQMAQAAALAIK